jgi:hypothetical protein
MRGRTDRKRAPRAWHPDRSLELLQLLADAQRHQAAEAEARRGRDARVDLAARMRQWFAGPELAQLCPTPSQPTDTVLGDRIGLPLTGELVNKRSSGAMRFYGRTSEIQKERWGAR